MIYALVVLERSLKNAVKNKGNYERVGKRRDYYWITC